jgi:hypothetical protein
VSQQAAITSQLLDMKDLQVSYHVAEFLSQRSATHPGEVVGLFLERIESAEALESLDGYTPTPYHWDVPLRVRDHNDFDSILAGLHGWVCDHDSWVGHEMGGRLFAAVANSFDDGVLAVLRQALNQPSQVSVDGVAVILRKAPRNLVFTNVLFVLEALDAAARFGDECEQRLSGALWSATMSGVRAGKPGEPFSEDVRQRDKCREIASGLPPGSLGERFYRALSASAEDAIRRTAVWDADDDHRSW